MMMFMGLENYTNLRPTPEQWYW